MEAAAQFDDPNAPQAPIDPEAFMRQRKKAAPSAAPAPLDPEAFMQSRTQTAPAAPAVTKEAQAPAVDKFIKENQGNQITGTIRELGMLPFKAVGFPESESPVSDLAKGASLSWMRHPIDAAENVMDAIGAPIEEQHRKAEESAKSGDYIDAGIRSVVGSIPLIGDPIIRGLETFRQGREESNVPEMVRGVGEAGAPVAQLALPGTKGGRALLKAGYKGIAKVSGATALSTAIPRVATAAGIPARLMNSVIRTKESSFRFGRNPGEQLAQEGISAWSENGLLAKIGSKIEEVGDLLDSQLKSPGAAAQQVDVMPLIERPINAAIKRARTLGNEPLATRLENLADGLDKTFYGQNGMMSPAEATELKRFIGENVRWTTDPIEGTVSSVLQDIYGNLKQGINAKVPGVATINERLANLLQAQKNLESAISRRQGLNVVSPLDAFAAGTGAVAGALVGEPVSSGALLAYLGRRAASSTAAKTMLARLLSTKPNFAVPSVPFPGAAGIPGGGPTPGQAPPAGGARPPRPGAQPGGAPVGVAALPAPPPPTEYGGWAQVINPPALPPAPPPEIAAGIPAAAELPAGKQPFGLLPAAEPIITPTPKRAGALPPAGATEPGNIPSYEPPKAGVLVATRGSRVPPPNAELGAIAHDQVTGDLLTWDGIRWRQSTPSNRTIVSNLQQRVQQGIESGNQTAPSGNVVEAKPAPVAVSPAPAKAAPEMSVPPEAQLKKMVSDAGGQYLGIQEAIGTQPEQVLFHDPQSGSTLQIPTTGATADAIADRIAASRAEYEAAQQKAPAAPPAEAATSPGRKEAAPASSPEPVQPLTPVASAQVPEGKAVSGGARMVPVDSISTDPKRFQPREGLAPGRVEAIRESIRERGYDPKEPVTIWRDPKNGKDYVLAGHHRFEAATEAGQREIPAHFFQGDEKAAMAYARRSNSTMAKLSPIEEGRAFQREIDEGKTPEQIGPLYGGVKSAYVEDRLALNNLAPQLQQYVQQGVLKTPLATALGKASGKYGLSEQIQLQIFDNVIKRYEITPKELSDLIDTAAPKAQQGVQTGLFGNLERGFVDAFMEMKKAQKALVGSRRALEGAVKSIDRRVKAGEAIPGNLARAKNAFAEEVRRLEAAINESAKKMGESMLPKSLKAEGINIEPQKLESPSERLARETAEMNKGNEEQAGKIQGEQMGNVMKTPGGMFDIGELPMDESPLFGGPRQQDIFSPPKPPKKDLTRGKREPYKP